MATYTGPSKDDFLRQIDGDLKGETEPRADLRERRKRVADAKDDEAAFAAYHGHLEELRAGDEPEG